MASGSAGQGSRNSGGARRRRLTAAGSRRITERYTAMSRSMRRGGATSAVPSRWLY